MTYFLRTFNLCYLGSNGLAGPFVIAGSAIESSMESPTATRAPLPRARVVVFTIEMSWETRDVLGEDTADVLAADTRDVLAADTMSWLQTQEMTQ